MHIAFIGQKGIPVSQGGVERHVEELSRAMIARGHSVLVYSRKTYAKGDGLIPAGVKVVEYPSIHVKAWDTIVATLIASIDVLFRRVDIIHYHSLGPAFFMFLPRLFKSSAVLVFTHHTYETQRPQWGIFARLAMKCGEAVGMALADEVIAISPTVAMDLENIYHRRVATVPNGVSQLPDNKTAEIPTALPPKYILTVSRLIRSKGLDHLINAFHLLSADFTDYHLVIVGSATRNDSDELRLRALAGGSDKIHFLGWQPSSKLSAIYSQASVFVQASEIEGMPIALLEAAAAGLPVVVSDIPEHTLITRYDALQFRSRNHIDLAAKLRLILCEPEKYRMLAGRLRARVIREFNWQHISGKIEGLYLYNHRQRKKMIQKMA